jgi:hypothetical protein
VGKEGIIGRSTIERSLEFRGDDLKFPKLQFGSLRFGLFSDGDVDNAIDDYKQKAEILLELIDNARKDLAARLYSGNALFSPELSTRLAEGLYLHSLQILSSDGKETDCIDAQWWLFSAHVNPVFLKLDYFYEVENGLKGVQRKQTLNVSAFKGGKCEKVFAGVLKATSSSTRTANEDILDEILGKFVIGSHISLRLPRTQASLPDQIVEVPALSGRKALSCLFAAAGIDSIMGEKIPSILRVS